MLFFMLFKFSSGKNTTRFETCTENTAIGQNRHHLKGFSFKISRLESPSKPSIRRPVGPRRGAPSWSFSSVFTSTQRYTRRDRLSERSNVKALVFGVLKKHTSRLSRYLPNGTNIAKTKRYIVIMIYDICIIIY